MGKKISTGKYNTLYGIAEIGLMNSWRDLGLTEKQVNDMANNNEDFTSPDQILSNIYYLMKKHCNYIVDEILNELDKEG